jgi:hypothetical protein
MLVVVVRGLALGPSNSMLVVVVRDAARASPEARDRYQYGH